MTDIRSLAVLGAGTMGAGIALTVARGGYEVVLVDRSTEQLERAQTWAAGFLRSSVERGKLTAGEAGFVYDRIRTTADMTKIADVSIVIEALPEDLELKIDVLRGVENLTRPTTALHSNTSTIPIASIAGRLQRPELVIGTHYCNPAPLMPLVEVAPGMHTADATTSTAVQFLRDIGKTPVVLRDTPGLLTNYLVVAFENDCIRALEAGLATPEDIDRAVTAGIGFPMGPFRLLDTVGLDVHLAVTTSLFEQLHDPRYAPPPMVRRMVDSGLLGQKSGRGFYEYESEDIA